MPHRIINDQLRGRSRALRREMTAAERRLWGKLRGRYVGDFVCFAKRVVIEVDGATHSTAAEVAADRLREEWLEQQGFCIRRHQNLDVLQNIEGVLTDIESALAPLSNSPPQGGREQSEMPLRSHEFPSD